MDQTPHTDLSWPTIIGSCFIGAAFWFGLIVALNTLF